MNAPLELRRYRTAEGRVPFSEWIADLDHSTVGRVLAYVDRMKSGHFGRSNSVGLGVLELKINFGPGYRVYYLRDSRKVIVLLCGGHKGSQQEDIQRAQQFAADYWRRL
jgi:putative addiction module killer protein